MKIVGLLALLITLGACSPEKYIEDTVYKMMEKDPQKFMAAIQVAAQKGRPPAPDPMKALEEEFKNPKQARIEDSRILGSKEAPITIVEYTDLQCPFCSRGHKTLEQVKAIYGDKVKVLRKHLPLPMHNEAKDLALYYELIAKQDLKKADKWVGIVFDNQKQSADKSKYDQWAKEVGADVKQIQKDLKDSGLVTALNQRITDDMNEARTFGIQGTPGYLVNGVSIKGAYPQDHFQKIIDRHLNK